MSKKSLQLSVVWFKRDLRVKDHAPLVKAITSPHPVLAIVLFEPSLQTAPDFDRRHQSFIEQSARVLSQSLLDWGITLRVVECDAVDFFTELLHSVSHITLFSHEETGNSLTYQRDRKVRALIEAAGSEWIEFPTNGVIRALRGRKEWSKKWYQTMEAPECKMPRVQEVGNRGWSGAAPGEISLARNTVPSDNLFQLGGENNAYAELSSFLSSRCGEYGKNISKPTESRTSCSRLSPYLAYGNLSVKQVYQAASRSIRDSATPAALRRQLNMFLSRVVWHCHFIQKFESECRIEFENFNREYDMLRREWNEENYIRWETGTTGFPLIDAAMRCVRATGYLNFRMRAMLVSFLSHALWFDWRRGAAHLARQFLDYEPGIHYPQFQMQASTTGIHTIRVYNPILQAEEHDPDAVFIREWIPELRLLPPLFAREPWRLTPLEQMMYGVILGRDYPNRCIDFAAASKHARDTLWKFQRRPEVKRVGAQIVAKHRTHPRGSVPEQRE